EGRFREAPELVAEGFSSSIVAAIPGSDDEPYGLIVVHSRAAGRFGFDEAVFLQAVTNTLAATRRRVEYEAQIRHYALHDAVTDLPNRTLFEDRVSRALASAVRRGRRVGVLFLDLDSFKLVCEGLCHASGDELLRGFAQRVGGCLRAEDTLARVGSDEFGVLLPELGREDDVMHVVHRIQNALRTPLEVRGREIVTSAAIGIALSQGAGQQETAGTLLRDADLAMYAAKADGPGSWRFYAEHMHESAVRQLELTSDLYQTLERGELEVHFQPIVSLDDEAIVGTEALVRWNHPRHGLLSPGIFLPIAEETGLIVPLGRFVLRTACATLAGWQASGLAARTVSVSVNLGRQQLLATDLTADVRAALADTGLDPACLILEITEDVLLNREVMIERLRELKALGLRLAVDDFGTGYSALSHLQRYPIDIIKIDKAFVDDIGESEDQTRLIQGIIELTHSLGLKTVAEGIETHGQAEALRTMGSELGQGFHFARPLPTRDLEALLAMPACSLSELELTIELGHQP
ncbi:MAG TPA: EAL domain-containing protein, partial [Solirubrobacteraceae bacterium]|nr:EAL domain-containing protein [Solirubrobacteraceae bacterium]